MKQMITVLLCGSLLFACNPSEKKDDESNQQKTNETDRGYVFGDDKYTDIANTSMNALSTGDADGFIAAYADNAVFRWSGGDSLNGKAAINNYWKKRRAEVIDSHSYSNQIWLPIKVDKPMTDGQLTGNYVLGWNMVHAKYKSGKSMSQRMHMVFHFDANDKIDRVTQYLDRVPINAAQSK
ncbi:MAG: nuclear transport factor 2 family protein [Segetibacter sp.]|nr:nuclear transport factor 2 family protein [Segetibacter sp.]